jgi:molybdopterin-guanine dinucleotide biosynthesis protein B
MRRLGIAGYSGSGKTTLIVRLLPLLRARGLEVATAKHAHHGFDPLPDGHPAAAWRAAGAREVLWDDPGSALHLHELRGENEPPLEALLPLIAPVDLLLIEGYKFGPHEKIEVFRSASREPPLATLDPRVVALVTDGGRPATLPAGRDLPIYSLNDVDAIAAFIVERCGRGRTEPTGTRPEHHDVVVS